MDLSKRIKRHVTAVPHEFRAVCHLGFERTCARELSLLGAEGPFDISPGAVDFSSKMETAWMLEAFSRTCLRLTVSVGNFKAENFGRLEKKAETIPWELYFPRAPLPSVKVTCKKSRLYHSDAVAERLQSVVHEALAVRGVEPLELSGEPQTLFVHLENDRCTLRADLSGEPLYKRGFNRYVEAAPIRDTLAASILLEAGLFRVCELWDPMAGSGTFSSEAAIWKAEAALWKTRKFALQDAPHFRPAAWNFLLRHAKGLSPSADLKIHAGDVSKKAVSTIRHNLVSGGAAPFLEGLSSGGVEISRRDFFSLPPASPESLLVLNPPYGKRLDADVPRLYREIGKKLRSDFSKSECAILVPGREAENALGIRPRRRLETVNGGIRVSAFFL